MLPETFRKVVVTQHGKNPHDCVAIVERPLRSPQPHELVVKNHYAGVNITDIGWILRLHELPYTPPFDLGVEAIGEVVAVGDRVEEYKVGDAVASALPGNGYRDYSVVDRNFAVKIPAIDPQMLGLFISGTIAKIALDFVADIQGHETVMVTSALGASGHYAVQLAKAQGCHVVGTCTTAEEAEIAKKLGVDRVINRAQEDVFHVLAEEYHDMLNVVFDNLGGRILDACIDHTAPRARVVLVEALREHLSGEISHHTLDLYHKVIRRSMSLIGFHLSDYANAVPIESLKLLDLLAKGEIQSLVDPQEFKGLDSVPSAIQHLMSGTSIGKIIIRL